MEGRGYMKDILKYLRDTRCLSSFPFFSEILFCVYPSKSAKSSIQNSHPWLTFSAPLKTTIMRPNHLIPVNCQPDPVWVTFQAQWAVKVKKLCSRVRGQSEINHKKVQTILPTKTEKNKKTKTKNPKSYKENKRKKAKQAQNFDKTSFGAGQGAFGRTLPYMAGTDKKNTTMMRTMMMMRWWWSQGDGDDDKRLPLATERGNYFAHSLWFFFLFFCFLIFCKFLPRGRTGSFLRPVEGNNKMFCFNHIAAWWSSLLPSASSLSQLYLVSTKTS